MTSDSRLSFEVSSIFSKTEGLSFVSMAVEEETEINRDLRRFAESLKKGFVSDKGFTRILNYIKDMKKSNWSQIFDRLERLKHSSALPSVFTEQGVAMLSSVLSSKRGIGAGYRNDGYFLGPQVTPLARRSSKAKPAPQG